MKDVDPSASSGRARDLLALARLHRPHGLRGEVRAEVLAPDLLDFGSFAAGREFSLRRQGRLAKKVRVKSLRPHAGGFLVAFEGHEDRTAAEAFKGSELCLPRSELPDLPEGWYWEDDLIGAEVVEAVLGTIGRVKGLREIGGQWSLDVSRPEGGSLTIPWVKEFIREVDPAGGRIDVVLPADLPGLADDPDS